jgi:hypothetical protein
VDAARVERVGEDAAREAILQAYIGPQRKIAVAELSLRNAVWLLATIRALASESMEEMTTCEGTTPALAPTKELEREMLQGLWYGGMLKVHPKSSKEAVVIQGGVCTGCVVRDVRWLPGFAGPVQLSAELEARMSSTEWWTEEWTNQRGEIIAEVELHECLRYYEIVAREHGFQAEAGPKTKQVFSSLLQCLEVGQVNGLTWRAAKDAAAFWVRNRTARQHAQNTIPGAVQRMYERARSEGWILSNYRRDYRNPESVLSALVFRGRLGWERQGEETPTTEAKDNADIQPRSHSHPKQILTTTHTTNPILNNT